MKRITLAFAVIGISCLFVTNKALAFVVQETDHEIPSILFPVPPNAFPEFAPSGYSFVREYDSGALSDGWMGFGWTWDLLGLKGFTSGIASFTEGLSTSTTQNLGDGSSWQFDLLTSRIDISYFNVSSTLLGTFRLDFDSVGRINKSTDYLGYVTVYDYSPTGDLVGITDPLGNQTTYLYNSSHLLQTRIDPWGNRTDFPVPEPTTLALMGLGLAGIRYRRHRSKVAA